MGFGRGWLLRWGEMGIARMDADWEVSMDAFEEKANGHREKTKMQEMLKNKKILVSGAISKFDGHIYTFNFLKKI